MSSKIRILCDKTINQIAAGEVIENPSSVIKELVENSLDAKAAQIDIAITSGGRKLIRISDNGKGMNYDDALLCFERHATSKFEKLDDMRDLMTMGFRGEALPSIASVAKMTLLTNYNQTSDATEVSISGGRLLHSSVASRRQGTTVEVRDLFFNVPVRREFQKSVSYDIHETHKLVTSLALANPDVKFSLLSDNKLMMSTSPRIQCSWHNNLKFHIQKIFGNHFVSLLCSVNFKEDDIVIKGFIGLPTAHRYNRSHQYLFLNHRYVSSAVISFAVSDGYGTRLANRRFPIYILHVEIPPHTVDVNVHPQKKEIRLKEEIRVKRIIGKAIDLALQGLSSIDPLDTVSVAVDSNLSSSLPFKKEEPWSDDRYLRAPPVKPNFKEPGYSKPIEQIKIETKSMTTYRNKKTIFEDENLMLDLDSCPRILGVIEGYLLIDSQSVYHKLRIPGQEDLAKGILLVDQSRAKARILFEKLIDALEKEAKSLEVQALLLPVTFDFSSLDSELILQYLEEFNRIGIQMHKVEENQFIVAALPALIETSDVKNLILRILEDLKLFDISKGLREEKQKRLALAACQAAARQSKALSSMHAEALFQQLMKCKSPYQSPTGKPTIIYLSTDEITKKFK